MQLIGDRRARREVADKAVTRGIIRQIDHAHAGYRHGNRRGRSYATDFDSNDIIGVGAQMDVPPFGVGASGLVHRAAHIAIVINKAHTQRVIGQRLVNDDAERFGREAGYTVLLAMAKKVCVPAVSVTV